jgi:hypothetical protein
MKITVVSLLCALVFALPVLAKPQLVKTFTPGPKGTVLLFVASGCPCMDSHRLIVQSLLKELQGSGINFYCIFSNEGETRILAEHCFNQIGWDTPYILDSQGKLADKYGATNTPQAIVLDAMRDVVFTGPIDDSSRNLGRVTQAYLQDALHDIMTGRAVQLSHVQPTGCWIVTKNGVKMAAGL